jgi:hypothetical protein
MALLLKISETGELRYFGSPVVVIRPVKATVCPAKFAIGNIIRP